MDNWYHAIFDIGGQLGPSSYVKVDNCMVPSSFSRVDNWYHAIFDMGGQLGSSLVYLCTGDIHVLDFKLIKLCSQTDLVNYWKCDCLLQEWTQFNKIKWDVIITNNWQYYWNIVYFWNKILSWNIIYFVKLKIYQLENTFNLSGHWPKTKNICCHLNKIKVVIIPVSVNW